MLNPVKPLLQYSFGLLTISKFVADNGAHEHTPSCDDIEGYPDVDSVIAAISTFMFYFVLPNLVYTFAKVLVPGGDDHLKDYNQEEEGGSSKRQKQEIQIKERE